MTGAEQLRTNPFGERNTISVAMCTYNGEQFLSQQLSSIAQQTRTPDELVVCDDRSTDRTVEILHAFAAFVTFPVLLVQNPENVGSVRNFEQAIRLCSGDLIALSDQDDLWFPSRLERSEQELLTHPQAGLVFSDGEMIDDQDLRTGQRLWQAFRFTAADRAELAEAHYDALIKSRFVTGATIMFRAALRERFLPLPVEWIHDEWIAAMVQAFSEVRPINEALICYRQHTSQQVGVPAPVNSRWRLKSHWNTLVAGEKTNRYWHDLARNLRFAQAICTTLGGMSLDTRAKHVLSCYQAWLRFATFRYNLPRRRVSRVGPVLRSYRWYSRYALGFKSAIKDIFRSRPQ